jgi:hypothetical protein
MPTDILTLSWKVQAALACGYLAYMISYIGIRAHHRTVDITFITLVFSLVATLAIFLLEARGAVWSVTGAVILCVAAGVFWRALGRDWYWTAVRALDLSWSNDDPSALTTLSGRTRHKITQIAVLLDDGTWLRCDDVNKFEGAAHWPCLIGPTGDVALYLTHEEPPGAR